MVVYGFSATHPKAPLCKGGCQKSLISDWGIVVYWTTPPAKIEDFGHLFV